MPYARKKKSVARRRPAVRTRRSVARRPVTKRAKGRISGPRRGGSIMRGLSNKAMGLATRYISKVAGLGAYSVKYNSLLTGPPVVTNTYAGTRIQHREYIGDVIGSVAFNEYYHLAVNPGVSATFPWLSGIAANYQQYKFHGLIFYFKSTNADVSTAAGGAFGTITMASDYNAQDSKTFLNKGDMANQEYSTSCKPSEDVAHPVECSPRETAQEFLYIRGDGAPSGDLRLYDLCHTSLGTVGQPSATTIGELYVSYDVQLLKPITLDHNIMTNWAGWARFDLDAATVTTAKMLGTNPIFTYHNDLGLTFDQNNSRIYFPVRYGMYIITWYADGASTTDPDMLNVTQGTNIGVTNIFNGVYASLYTNVSAAGTSKATKAILFCCRHIINEHAADNSQTYIQFNASVLPGTISRANVVIIRVNDYLNEVY